MLFQPLDVMTRVKQKVEDSFYMKLNGEPSHQKLTEPMFLARTGTGLLPVTAGVSGVIMPFNVRKEPVPFRRIVDQFHHIEDRVAERPVFILGGPLRSNLRFFG